MVSSQVSDEFDLSMRGTTEQGSDRFSRSFRTIEPARLNAGLNRFDPIHYNQDISYVGPPDESFGYKTDASINYLHYQKPHIGKGGSAGTLSSSCSGRWL